MVGLAVLPHTSAYGDDQYTAKIGVLQQHLHTVYTIHSKDRSAATTSACSVYKTQQR